MKISFQHEAAVVASKCINTAFRVDNYWVTLPSPALRLSSLSRGWCGRACRACCPSGARSCTSCWCPACVGAPPAAMTLKYILCKLHHNWQWNTNLLSLWLLIWQGLTIYWAYTLHTIFVASTWVRVDLGPIHTQFKHQLSTNILITKYRHWNFSIV